MARKTGGKLRPGNARSSRKAPQDQGVLKVLLTLVRKGLVASQASFNRLRRWLQHMNEGSTVDYRTIFYSKRDSRGRLVYGDRAEIVTQFDQVYKSAAKDPILGEYLHEIEMEERGRIGPMSPFLPWPKDGPKKAAAVFCDKPQLSSFNKPAYKRALDRFQSLVASQSCELISPDEAIKGVGDDGSGMDTSTNSGTPWWLRKWKPSLDTGAANGREFSDKDQEVAKVYQWICKEVGRWYPSLVKPMSTNELPVWYATASQRLVQKGPEPFNPKSKRLVIAYPKEEAILARMFTVNVMNQMRQVKMPGGNRLMNAWFDLPTIDQNMQITLWDAHKRNECVNSGDVSNFDATVPPWLLLDVGRMIATWVRGGKNFVENLFKAMIYRTVLITPSGLYGPGASSMKSGSGVTNLGGSGANVIIQFYGEECGYYKLSCLSVLGDDFNGTGPGYTPESTSNAFAAFGMEAHPDKQYYRPDALQYLKRLHYRGIPGGIASVYRTLGSCLSLERLATKPEDWNKFAYVIQALSKLNNASFNPYFTDLVKFLAQGDRLHLGAEMTPQEVVSGAGDTGTKILSEDARHSWKRMGSNQEFANWLVNGVLRGEVAPPPGNALFERVYGIKPTLVA